MGRRAGYKGVFAIEWAQTEVWGERAPDPELVCEGALWRWRGRAQRLDGPDALLTLGTPLGGEDLRLRVARKAERLTRRHAPVPASQEQIPPQLAGAGFVLSDGLRHYPALRVETALGALVILGPNLPPEGQDLWVVESTLDAPPRQRSEGAVICFTPGTRIETGHGPRPVEALRAGDLVQTRDDGLQPVLWRGETRISGAELYLQPELRPVRLRRGAMGTGCPDAPLVVSPRHRVLLGGPQAMALFNTPEVLVAACDLLDDYNITRDYTLASVTYVHLMLERHQVIRANGLYTESFHPEQAAAALTPAHEQQILAALPTLSEGLAQYGPMARRCLSRGEAAILCHETGVIPRPRH